MIGPPPRPSTVTDPDASMSMTWTGSSTTERTVRSLVGEPGDGLERAEADRDDREDAPPDDPGESGTA